MAKTYEIRDPIHGFIVLNEWERDLINHPVFQRLRRIRQLAWTDMVGGLKAVNQTRIYVPYSQKDEAKQIIEKLQNGGI